MSSETNSEHHHCSLEFYVTCETQMGDEVIICGNSFETGNWNPNNGHKLYTDQTLYPVWKSLVPLILRNNSKILFKACIISPSGYTWQSSIPNRQNQPQIPCIIKFSFNQRGERTIQKKIKEIECREGTFDIIEEMESSEGSSVDFRTSYPIENYFQHGHDEENGKNENGRKLSSGMSSNLFSVNGENEEDKAEQDTQQQVSQDDKQMYEIKMEKVRTPELMKTQSIRPILIPINIQDPKYQHHLKVSQIKVRNRSKSRSNKRSESGSKSRKDQSQSPFMIRVPGSKKYKHISKINTNFEESSQTSQPKSSNQEILAEQKSEHSSDLKNQENEDTDSSTSTVIEYDTENDYLDNRDLDVVIEQRHKEFIDI